MTKRKKNKDKNRLEYRWIFTITIVVLGIIQFFSKMGILMAIDVFFLIGLWSLTFASIIIIYQTGFVSLFLYGFIKVKQMIFLKSKVLMDEEEKMINERQQRGNRTNIFSLLKRFLLGIGFGAIVYSLILLSLI